MITLGTYRQISESWTREILPNSLSDEMLKLCRWTLNELHEKLNLPTEWLRKRLDVILPKFNDVPCEMAVLSLSTEKREPFLWVIVKRGNIEDAEVELRKILLSSSMASSGFCTNGKENIYLIRRYDSNSCEYANSLNSHKNCADNRKRLKRALGANNDLRQISSKVENLFFDIHSLIRDIDGMHADEALDELCKILYTKIYDEETTEELQAYRFQGNFYISDDELATGIRVLYKEAVQYDERVYGLKIPSYARSRGVFGSQIRLSTPTLTKIVEALQDFSISNSHIDIKGRAFQKLYLPSIRAGMGQYFTPQPVIDFMVRVANPSTHQLILDPFCGSAHFLSACLDVVHRDVASSESKAWFEFAFGKLHGIEKSDRMVRVAMTDMRLHGDGHSNIRCTDSLLPFSNYVDIQPNSFDLILTNPPFGSVLHAATFSQLGDFNLLSGRKSVPLEVLGLERCIQFLRPGGKLGIVLPEGILVNKNASYVREWLKTTCKIRAIISLPVETFAPFGAMIKTSIIFASKRLPKEEEQINLSIFMGRADDVGYDSSGKMKKENDLLSIADELERFLLEEGW